ncbi:MAG TPA: ABC transporter permease [Bryobacteraceae bacterium]|nr:ABC transporter permease [Bryobacteraceae bacterium]
MKWHFHLGYRSRMRGELAAELESHIEEKVVDLMEAGMPERDARQKALRDFGNAAFYADVGRDVWGWNWLEILWKDVRYALRGMRQNPGFTAVAVVMLGLGIGANTTIFSFIDAFFLRPLPVEDPLRLVSVYGNPNVYTGFCYPEYAYFRDHSTVFIGLAAHYSTAPLNVVADGDSREATGAVVSANYFSVLGVNPLLGRFFSVEEDTVPDHDYVAVVSYGMWQRRFGGGPAILGKTVKINGTPFSIIGVTPEDFHGVLMGSPNDMWIPTMTLHVGWRGCDAFQFDCRRMDLIGRLAPGRRVAEAQAEMSTLAAQIAAANPLTNRGRGALALSAVGPRPGDRKYYSDQSRILAVVAVMLLLIACANVAGLLVARSSARSREMAVRLSIGAGRLRLIRQLLTESLLLAGFGGVLGLWLSILAKGKLLGFYATNSEGYKGYYDLSLDMRVLAFSIGLSLLTGLLFGLLPAIQSTSGDLTSAVKEGAMSRRRGLLRGWLVAGQIALSLALMVGAGLLMRSANHVSHGLNFNASHVAILRLRPGLVRYTPARAQAFHEEVVRRLEALPGVQSVSFARGLGLAWLGCCQFRLALPRQPESRLEDAFRVDGHSVAPRYFETLQIPLVAGREFTQRDRIGAPFVTIVNETLARRLWPQASAIGRTLFLDDRQYQVVGVAKDARLRNAVEGPFPFLYIPYWQDEPQTDSRMCIRVAGDPAEMLPRIRHEIATVDANIPISEDMAMTRQVEGVYMPVRLSSSVATCAAGLALLLSAIGLYGVLSFSVNRRSREIGIRMALGALPASVLKLVLTQGMALALLGAVLGLFLSLTLTRLLASWLYGVPPYDMATYLACAFLLTAVAGLACYLPARRATQIDPLAALRHE